MAEIGSRRSFVASLLAVCAVGCAGTSVLAQQAVRGGVSAAPGSAPLPKDLSVGVIDQILKDHPTPASLGKWGYTQGLTLYGMERVYRRTHDERYLKYIRGWADAHVDVQGKIDRPIDALDDMLPGLLMLALYQDTGESRYKLAAETIRRRFDTYPRTTDGGFWHGAVTEHQHQLWLDGTFMSLPFLVRYGEMFGERDYVYREAARQLLLDADHLRDAKTGLLFHAYDELGTEPWAQLGSRHSSYFWGRSIGWYGMALVEVLENMPKTDPDCAKLIEILRGLVAGLARFQDPQSGLWYNVVDRASEPGNWLESSASSMYIYVISKAVEAGYVSKSYEKVACKGYRGIRRDPTATLDGAVSLSNICAGSVVGDLQYYLDRPRNTNDIHGLGPFLLMNEQMRKSPCVRSEGSGR